MIIKKVHIENFGKLKNFDLDFDNGLNTINQCNGWGKSTLACFIKSMFYGLPASRSQDLNVNERKKYMPWQGGQYGGYIIYQIEEKTFQITRFFGTKESEDFCSLISLQTGKQIEMISGEQIFGIDADAFERCVYLPQKDLQGGINESMQNKLTNIIHGTNNVDNLDSALQVLDKQRAELKRKNGLGEIPQTVASINKLAEEISEIKTEILKKDMFVALKSEEEQHIIKISQQLEDIDKNIKIYGETQKVLANKKLIEEKQQQFAQLKKQITGFDMVLDGNNLSESDLSDAVKNQSELEQLKSKLEILQNNNALQKMQDIQNQFVADVPSKQYAFDVINEQKQSSNQTIQTSKKSNTLNLMLLILGIVCAICSFVFLGQIAIFAVMLCIGVLLLIFSGVLYFKNYIDNRTGYNSSQVVQESENQKNLASQLKKQEDTLQKTLLKIVELATEYQTAKDEHEQNINNIEHTKIEIHSKLNCLQTFLQKFKFEDGLATSQKIDNLYKIHQNYNTVKNQLQEIENQLCKLGKVEDSENLPQVDITELQKQQKILRLNLDEHLVKQHNAQKRIDEINDLQAQLEEKQSEIKFLEQTKKFQEDKLDTIQKATSFLEVANSNLSAKYLSPISTKLCEYLQTLTGENFEKLNINIDLECAVEEFGKNRDIQYLSKGYIGAIDVCLRFALIDTLFKTEKPFVILDDPFVNLDEEKLQRALSLINKISDKYQIVYLTCHSSRI